MGFDFVLRSSSVLVCLCIYAVSGSYHQEWTEINITNKPLHIYSYYSDNEQQL
mgnify:CR=1